VLRELGRGGMAMVYLARDVTHDRVIALKLLRADVTGVASGERFLREIRTVANLQHPNILPLHDSGILDIKGGLRLPFYTMPYVEGESLRERLLVDRKPTTAEAVRIIREIADALAAAHAAGVVHRDLKPENVLLSQGHAMVSDFGIATAMSSRSGTDNITATGLVLGTPLYMSPEQALGDQELDHRADLYSLGLIAYELFTGSHPFGMRTPPQILVAHATVTPEPLRKVAPHLDSALGALVMRLIEKRPGDRPQSATEVVAELDAIAAGTALRRDVSRRAKVAIAGVVVLTALGAYAWYGLGPRASAGADAVVGTPGASVAVLPFENVSGDEQQQYLSDGMSDEIAHALGSVEGLRVAPRASAFAFRGRSAEFRVIGAQLNVAHVIEGRLRKSGNRLRVNVQLINVASGNADWSEQYERDMSDVFQVQDDIARAIVGALGARLAAGANRLLAGAGTRSLEAHDLYLKGRYFYGRISEQNLRLAELLFNQAIQKDPSYGRAYSGLSDTYTLLGVLGLSKRDVVLQSAREAAAAAVRLDSTSAEAYTSLGFVRLFYDWNWTGAHEALERAIKLNPRYAPAREWHMFSFVATNQLDSALSEGQRAAQIDPMAMSANVGWMLQVAGRHTEAVAELEKTLALDSTNVVALARIAPSLVALGRCDDALRAITSLHALRYSLHGMTIGYVLASCNRRLEARASAGDIERRYSQVPLAPLLFAAVYAGLDEKDSAFKWLDRAYAARIGPLYKLRSEVMFASLRTDPRFQAIVSRMQFP
jgi:serine/threonine-protein kinase